MSRSAVSSTTAFGDLVRYWRRVRAMSQLDLAAAAATTPRYMSFVETGRSQPSREMVQRLAIAMDIPLRDRNGLLVAAGFAPMYPEHDIDDPAIEQVMRALQRMLDVHDPYPAVVMDRRWNVVRANNGAARLFGGLCAPDPVPDPANVLQLMLEPGPVRAAVRNWNEVAPALLERARREAVGGVMDLTTAELVHRLRTGADAAVLVHPARSPRSCRSSTSSSPSAAARCAGSRSSRRSARPSTSPPGAARRIVRAVRSSHRRAMASAQRTRRSGLAHDVVQVRDPTALRDGRAVEEDRRGLDVVEVRHAASQHDWDEVECDLVE